MLKTSISAKRSARLVLAGMLILLPVTVWLTTELWRETRLVEITEDGRNKLELYQSNLQGAIKEHEYLPITLASDKRILDLAQRASPADAAAVNIYLEKLADDSGASDIYFMDRNGTTIAASNWNSDASFVGRNFAFRPYFKQAEAGLTGHYFAFGITSNVPGYYISHPVRPNGADFEGAMVVKTHLETLVQRWARGNENVLVTDENGIVIITSRPEWRFRDLAGIPPSIRPELMASRKYGNYPLDPMPVHQGAWPDDDTLGILSLASSETAPSEGLISDAPANKNAQHTEKTKSNPKPYLVTRSTLPRQGWKIYLLTDKAVLDQSILTAGFIGGAMHIIVMGTIFVLLQRRRAMLEQIEIRDWSQRELERQVRLRTADLMSTNLRLAEEISERRRTEDALRTAQAELVQAGKLAALGQMSAGIAHEINQPLTAIRSYADNALKFISRGNNETASRNLGRISELTERMGRITNHLKTFARRPKHDTHPVDITEPLQKVIDLLRETGRAGLAELDYQAVENLPLVTAEENQLEQVFLNILSNAADACRDEECPTVGIAIAEKGNRILVKISDNGPGILPENLPQLFDPFFTTKPFGDGLGLGLSICYGIMRSFGGTIRAENRPAGGACFTIELRCAQQTDGKTPTSISTAPDTPDTTGTETTAIASGETDLTAHRMIAP
ncbi:sensor histidine kinase [Thalassospira alkalitolerans]|uniref:sensor histidine kinase n=1 Tax=Thalassospira alkalitolerans TaxID=1293890 RepID=UPI003AA8F63F